MAKGIIIGAILVIVTIGFLLTYTNAFEVLKPEVEYSVDKAKNAISQVDGADVVQRAEEVTSKIKNTTDKIRVSNPLELNE
ncbi:hypothetical protein [Nitrosopumilus sp.]|uniref:hypothetical protein n=1 Tax=Nitrosopumilus sp. TaxID=2024843 RepID=UPI003B5B86EC